MTDITRHDEKSVKARTDNWRNNLTMLGEADGRTNNTKVANSIDLSRYDLDTMYESNGLAKKIVNTIVDDALRGFINAEDNLIEELERVHFQEKLTEACYTGRLYGGALLVAFVDDAREMNKPLDLQRVNKVISFRVFDRHLVVSSPADLCTDVMSARCGENEYYTIVSDDGQDNLRVHHSRCVVLSGDLALDRAKKLNQDWHFSVLKSCFQALRHYGIIAESTTEIVHDFVQVIAKIDGLMQTSVTKNGAQNIAARLSLFAKSRATSNPILLDSANESYEKNSSSVSGLPELWDRFSEAVCSVTGYPITKLFGRSSAGLNSTGESDLKNYYDLVESYRARELKRVINWAVEVVASQHKVNITETKWDFKSLLTPSDEELALLKKTYAEIDAMYIDRNAVDAEEVWQARFGDAQFNRDIALKKRPSQYDEEREEEIDEISREIDDEEKEEEEEKITKKTVDKLCQEILQEKQ
jgi:hypothetical protein